MKKMLFAATAVIALSFTPAVSFAETRTGSTAHEIKANERLTPEQFVTRSMNGNMFEVEAGRVALDKAQNEDVKEFAQQMVDDHTKAKENLAEAIEEQKVTMTVPAKLDSEHAAIVEKLKAAEGGEFDKLYVAEMKKAHEKTLSLLTSYSQNGKDGPLKEFATDTLDTVKEHHEKINEIKI
jgi:putative membrane protein